MGMNTHVIGFRECNAHHRHMVEIAQQLQEMDMDPTPQLLEYFKDTDYPHCEIDLDLGLEVEIEKTVAVQKHNADMQDGFEIDVRKLPEGVVRVRVYNSY